MSQRTAGKITEILDTHVSVAAVEASWRAMCRQVRAVVGAIPGKAAARIPTPTDPGARPLQDVLEELIHDALQELHDKADDGAMLAELPELPPDETPPTVTRSHTLAEARAQCATLQADLIDLRGRIVPARRR